MKRYSILIPVVIVAGILAVQAFYGAESKPQAAPVLASTEGGQPVPPPKKKTKLPQGADTFHVMQAENAWPKFVEITVDPVDVHVGQTQNMAVILQDNEEITSVEAVIKTDHFTYTVPLKLTGSVSEADLSPARYALGKNSELVLAPASKKPPVAVANAAEPVKYKYEGSWVVKDTHDTVYITEFVAKDAAGRVNTDTFAWSDACNIPVGGSWSITSYGNCTISGVGAVDGVDNGTTTIATYSLTITNSAVFAFNSGRSIVVNSGAINISASGQIVQTNLWMVDADNDNYPDSGTQYAQSGAPANGKRRNVLVTISSDCSPGDAGSFQYLAGYVDNDSDGHPGNGPYQVCSGNSLPGGYYDYTDDCLDTNGNVYQQKYVTWEGDQDGHGDGAYSWQCVGSGTPLGFGNFTHYYNTSGSRTWADNAYSTTDCDDGNVNVYQNYPSLIQDADHEGYTTGSAATRCVGTALSLNGRTYYDESPGGLDGGYPWLPSGQAVGSNDCEDLNRFVWAAGGGGTDRNQDQLVREGSPLGGLCVGDVGQDPWYQDANGSLCWLRASQIVGYNQSAAADGGGAACAQ